MKIISFTTIQCAEKYAYPSNLKNALLKNLEPFNTKPTIRYFLDFYVKNKKCILYRIPQLNYES